MKTFEFASFCAWNDSFHPVHCALCLRCSAIANELNHKNVTNHLSFILAFIMVYDAKKIRRRWQQQQQRQRNSYRSWLKPPIFFQRALSGSMFFLMNLHFFHVQWYVAKCSLTEIYNIHLFSFIELNPNGFRIAIQRPIFYILFELHTLNCRSYTFDFFFFFQLLFRIKFFDVFHWILRSFAMSFQKFVMRYYQNTICCSNADRLFYSSVYCRLNYVCVSVKSMECKARKKKSSSAIFVVEFPTTKWLLN